MRNLRNVTMPFVVLAALATTQCATNSARIVEGLPAGINLTDAKSVEIRDTGGGVVLRGTFSNYKAPLTNTGTNAKGLAEIEIEKVGTDLKQEIEVDVENLPPSVNLKLVVDGKDVATFLTSSAGKRTMKYTRKDPSR
jgi:hypothetical protein